VSKDSATFGPRKEWLMVGKSIEVKWENEWWQATIKKVKADKSSDKIEKVFVSYVGGTTDEDEWIPYTRFVIVCVREIERETERDH